MSCTQEAPEAQRRQLFLDGLSLLQVFSYLGQYLGTGTPWNLERCAGTCRPTVRIFLSTIAHRACWYVAPPALLKMVKRS